MFSGSLGKTKMDPFRCDSFGNRIRTKFKNKNQIETTFVESYVSMPFPSLSPFQSMDRSPLFLKKKSLERNPVEKSWNGPKHPLLQNFLKEEKQKKQWGGSLRPLEAKMNGCAFGYVLFLKLIGLGYKFSLYPSKKFEEKSILSIKVGHSHKMKFFIPKSVGIFLFPRQTLALFSSEKEILGNLAHQIRSVRPPTPYKGKGIRFLNESIVLKEGKKTK